MQVRNKKKGAVPIGMFGINGENKRGEERNPEYNFLNR